MTVEGEMGSGGPVGGSRCNEEEDRGQVESPGDGGRRLEDFLEG